MFRLIGLGLLLATTNTVIASTKAPEPWGAIPTTGQIQYHRMGIIGLIHYGPNTYRGVEWGFGDTPPSVFNPDQLDTDQWIDVSVDAEIKGLILVAKHHDGFCLWPAEGTDYSVKASPWKQGKGNLVADFVTSCRERDMKIGFYLSPWDRNYANYARPEYITYFYKHWEYLLTNYGEVFEVWFDGANGGDGYYGGARERRSIRKDYYDYPRLMKMLQKYQPNVVAFGSKEVGGTRWPGNERGYVPETNWCAVNDKIKVDVMQGTPHGTIWQPDEADMPLRRFWFWRQGDKPNTLEYLVMRYFHSVGRNAVYNLGLAPNKQGLLGEDDAMRLREFGDYVRRFNATEMAHDAVVVASATRGNDQAFSAAHTVDGNLDTYWTTDDDVRSASLTLTLPQPRTFDTIDLSEYIQLGQRVKSWYCEVLEGDTWRKVATGTTIGGRRMVSFEPVTAKQIRVTIVDAYACPTLSKIGLKLRPPLLAPKVELVQETILKSVLWQPVGSLPQSTIIDLGVAKSVRAFVSTPVVKSEKDSLISHYTIDVSQDGKSWTQIRKDEFANIKANPVPQRLDLPANTIVRYARFTATNCTGSLSGAIPQIGSVRLELL